MKNLIGRTRRADIRFYPDGKIEISQKVTSALGLKAGDILNVGEESGEYYIYAVNGEGLLGRHEAQCRTTNTGRSHLRAYSKRLCQAVIACAKTDGVASLLVGEEMQHPHFGCILPLLMKTGVSYQNC